MLLEVTCRCGWSTRGSRTEVIRNVQAHAQSAHNLEVTPAEIKAIWRLVPEIPPTDRQFDAQR